MRPILCINGHEFDADSYYQCPYCGAAGAEQPAGQYVQGNGENAGYDQAAGYQNAQAFQGGAAGNWSGNGYDQQYQYQNNGNYQSYDQQAGYYDRQGYAYQNGGTVWNADNTGNVNTGAGQEQTELKQCPSCFEMIYAKAKFCPKCGTRVADVTVITNTANNQAYDNSGYQQVQGDMQNGYGQAYDNAGYQQVQGDVQNGYGQTYDNGYGYQQPVQEVQTEAETVVQDVQEVQAEAEVAAQEIQEVQAEAAVQEVQAEAETATETVVQEVQEVQAETEVVAQDVQEAQTEAESVTEAAAQEVQEVQAEAEAVVQEVQAEAETAAEDVAQEVQEVQAEAETVEEQQTETDGFSIIEAESEEENKADTADTEAEEVQAEAGTTEEAEAQEETKEAAEETAETEAKAEEHAPQKPVKKKKPVVGWLACIKGELKGSSFNVYTGKNTVGNGGENAINLEGDPSVLASGHAMVALDLNLNFFVLPGNGAAFVNGTEVSAPKFVRNRDTITFGDGDYIFISLLDRTFNWKEYLQG